MLCSISYAVVPVCTHEGIQVLKLKLQILFSYTMYPHMQSYQQPPEMSGKRPAGQQSGHKAAWSKTF